MHDSFFPLNLTIPSQSSESPPPPLSTACISIPVGGRLAHILEHWGDIKGMGPFCLRKSFKDSVLHPFPTINSSYNSQSIFLSLIRRKNSGTSRTVERVSNLVNFGFYSWCTQKEGELSPVINLSMIYIKEPFKM